MPTLPPPHMTPDEMEELTAWMQSALTAGAAAAGGKIAAEGVAREMAGALVGMRWDAEAGQWTEAARDAYRICDDLRDAINEAVTGAIERGDSVATLRGILRPMDEQVEGRALAIARTEAATAYNTGQAAAWAADGVEYVLVSDGEGCLPQGHDDSADLPDPDVIGMQEDRQADGQTWTIDDAAAWPVGHPNCRRDFSPVVPEGSGEGEGG